ncbi:expressed protein [Phakopsora pachyrhizi]|uniref:Expressed protein n=1 Tax=Phakopsora pachyrhizi TaxID=170000 RepID=A0AAV0AKQ0_PHAPC|nr:expressed protein [Phakopsora pachyrhizi]
MLSDDVRRRSSGERLMQERIGLRISLERLVSNEVPISFVDRLEGSIRLAEGTSDSILIQLEITESEQQQRDGVDAEEGSLAFYFNALQTGLANIYVKIETFKQMFGKVLLNVDVILTGMKDEDVTRDASKSPSEKTKAGDVEKEIERLDLVVRSRRPGHIGSVALGGTFDHLHSGHKILLTMASWLARKRIIVGVTDDELLTSKQFKEHLQPISERISTTENFIRKISSDSLEIETFRLRDVYGPTTEEVDLQAIIVSKETLDGARLINEVRSSKGLDELQTFVIDLIGSGQSKLQEINLKDLKMSSTEIRRWLSKQVLGSC